MRSWLNAGLAIVGGALVAPAASDVQDVKIAIGSSQLKLPTPAGFCSPDAATSLKYNNIFAGQPDITLLATLVRCDAAADDPLQDYTVIVAPTFAMGQSVSRKELMAKLAGDFDPPEYRAFIANEVSGSGPAKPGSIAKIELGDPPVALGHDEVYLYLAGERGPSIGHPYSTRVAACMTAVNDKVLTIYRYADPRFGKSFAVLLREARAIALSVRVAVGN